MKRGAVAQNSGVAVVTGGSSGIGAEFARTLASYGYALVLVSNSESQLADIKANLAISYPDTKVYTMCADLSLPGAAAKVEDYCVTRGLTVDVLVNNAGIFSFREMAKLPAEKVSLYIDLHMRAVTELSLIFGKEMALRGHGYILNMSSMSCWMPMPGIGLYAATKSYIRVFSRALRLELKESGVKVMVACPGGIATDLFGLPPKLQRLGVRLGVLATPQKFVAGALKRLFAGRAQYVNGLLNRISIVAVSILPARVKLIVKHQMLDKQKP